MRYWLCTIVMLSLAPGVRADADWSVAEKHGQRSQAAVQFCRRYAHGWLAQADGATGLLPRTLRGDDYWNAKDCAADNFPFLMLTAAVTDDYYLLRAVAHIQQQELLANRVDLLPDDFLFATHTFRPGEPNIDAVIFGAAEYAKDGLMPVTEWRGPGPWLDRMQGLIRDIWKHAPHDTPAGKLPSTNVEVNGDLLQVCSRLYWITGDEAYKGWAFRLADHYLLHENLLAGESLRLRDHGCEIIGGLSEACVIASREDAVRWRDYKPRMRAILDRVLEVGVNDDGMMYDIVDPRDGKIVREGLSDGWGYVYNAFLTMATLTGEQRYRAAVSHALDNIHKYANFSWEGDHGADGFADSIEGALSLLNRIPGETGFAWVDAEIDHIFEKQRPDGIIEGWYGDGNSARTALMFALQQTQGITAAPWRDDIRLGAVRESDGSLLISIACDWAWQGRLRFDRQRHREDLHLPLDYPRINQFPEWFTIEPNLMYEVTQGEGEPRLLAGRQMRDLPVTLKPGESIRITVAPRAGKTPPLRTRRYSHRDAEQARAWQNDLREELFKLLKLDDLRQANVPLDAKVISSSSKEGYVLREFEIRSTPQRTIRILLTTPLVISSRVPAVVCIHGHGGNRHIVHDESSIYHGFAAVLARTGIVTIAADVGQHEVYEQGRTLMGERLWDLMRCVDYLQSLPEVDRRRIGCAGLSLGGEMAMWLAAMDPRIAATVSSGFLTTMDQMEQGHCMCWKFPGLRELVDYADIYSLIAPRALQCQNGLAEPPGSFIVPLAREAMAQIRAIYADLGQPEGAELAVHNEGHVIDLPSLTAFFARRFDVPIEP